jgi:hypothetical protein
LFAQGLSHGMGAGLGHRGEDETVTMGHNHVSPHKQISAPLQKEGGRTVDCHMRPSQNL